MPRNETAPAASVGYQQDRRLIAVQTPLGADAMILLSFDGEEALSQPFEYNLKMVASQDDEIKPGALVGKPISFSVTRHDGSPRPFHGYVRRLTRDAGAKGYSATVVPWLWFLTRTSNCRIFQNMSVTEIIEQVFKDFGFPNYEISDVKGEHPSRVYCVQYLETAFDFISRLMEEEGIFYYFRHDEGKHTLILADQVNAYQDTEEDTIEFAEGTLPHAQIASWDRQFDFCSGKWAHTDYNFETPSTSIAAHQSTAIDLADSKLELFDYPGAYQDQSMGDVLARIRIEELEMDHDMVVANSSYRTLHPGHTFNLTSLIASSDAKKGYVITRIEHHASSNTYATTGGGGESYHNRFTCIPKETVFRPRRVTPKPVISGPQTAVVVGPKGEEIYTDKYGRIKVQFHWDRLGAKDDGSSCWIRVRQVSAGKNWGGLFIPRVGQEVIVEFLDGDPNRPIVTGAVYNADNMPPWELPGERLTSGLASRSSKKGTKENANFFTFDDTKGEELVTLHAEKNALREVENDETVTVGNNQNLDVQNNLAISVKQGKYTLEAAEAVELKVGQSTVTLKPDRIELKIGSSCIKLDVTNVKLASTFTTVSGELTADVKSLVTNIEADTALTLQGTVVNIN